MNRSFKNKKIAINWVNLQKTKKLPYKPTFKRLKKKWKQTSSEKQKPLSEKKKKQLAKHTNISPLKTIVPLINAERAKEVHQN